MNDINVVLCGDSAEVLRQYPDGFFDSVVCDPPYGLSKEPNITEVLTKWIAGETYDHGNGGFMSKSWDSFVPHPDLWREVFRVLKPGGHALVFAGTRTQDLMTIAMRLGGFEIRDVIEWLYFSGFPKSMDVGKAFDKRAGIQGERVEAEGVGFMNAEGKGGYNVTSHRILMPERQTELARKWDGWGTALKPAHEPIIVARKPLAGTVAETVEKYGTGAINIDGCRIGRAAGDRTEYGNYLTAPSSLTDNV
ncbi:DNA methyltransferase [Paenibacillus dakarensis]|uniref:DNA methyltransferase n=1 Tax=Paenibacillus dakarensis TaxID=1527293 RepID=UPI0006D59069|nr:DNA methyltransferase [Paenibacillus dakarensis]